MSLSQGETARFLGISQQRLSYWIQRDAISVEGGGKPGIRYRFTPADVFRALVVKELLEAGANLHEIRTTMDVLRDMKELDDLREDWICVEPGTGEATLYDSDRQALLRLKDSRAYLVDINSLKRKVRQGIQMQEEEVLAGSE